MNERRGGFKHLTDHIRILACRAARQLSVSDLGIFIHSSIEQSAEVLALPRVLRILEVAFEP